MYRTVYEYTKPGFELIYIIPILFLIIGIGLVIFNFNKKNGHFHITPLPFIIGCGAVFFGLIGIIAIPINIAKKNRVMDIINNKEYSVVEGKIENFHPMPKAGKEDESFTVNGVFFGYSDHYITYGFNNSSTFGGPLTKNGRQVRISYITDENDNKILKLELAEKE